jgi:uncharacterized membrane protein
MTPTADALELAAPSGPTDHADDASTASWRARHAVNALAWGLAAALFAIYAALAIRDQRLMLTGGYDLGIFDEAVRLYAHGHLPNAPLKGFDLLGDHFSPIWAVLAPIYRLFPSAYTLLLAQAALMAVAAVPLVRWAAREIGLWTAASVGTCYGLSWGIASAAGFDVHEVAFAVPMLAFSATALGQRRWRAAVAWGAPLLLVKEDLGFTLAAIGLYIAARGARRLGLITAAVGVLGSILEVKVLIPAFSPGGNYTYEGNLRSVLNGGLTALPDDLVHLISPQAKLITMLALLAAAGFVAVRAPITLLAVPTLAWRFLSTNKTYWGTGFQYSAVLMPIVFAGLVHALILLRAGRRREVRALAYAGIAASVATTALLLPRYPLWALTHRATWSTPARIAAAHHVIAMIPSNTTVAAGNQLDPQLTDRDDVSLLDPQTPAIHPAWVLLDTDYPGNFPLKGGQQAQIIAQLRAEGYRTVADESGFLLLER